MKLVEWIPSIMVIFGLIVLIIVGIIFYKMADREKQK